MILRKSCRKGHRVDDGPGDRPQALALYEEKGNVAGAAKARGARNARASVKTIRESDVKASPDRWWRNAREVRRTLQLTGAGNVMRGPSAQATTSRSCWRGLSAKRLGRCGRDRDVDDGGRLKQPDANNPSGRRTREGAGGRFNSKWSPAGHAVAVALIEDGTGKLACSSGARRSADDVRFQRAQVCTTGHGLGGRSFSVGDRPSDRATSLSPEPAPQRD